MQGNLQGFQPLWESAGAVAPGAFGQVTGLRLGVGGQGQVRQGVEG